MNPLLLSHYTVTSCIGRGVDQTLDALHQQRGGLEPCAFNTVDLLTGIGEVAGVDETQLPTGREYDDAGRADDGGAQARRYRLCQPARQRDPALDVDYVLDNRQQPIRHALSNSIGFGGTNCSLIFGRAN